MAGLNGAIDRIARAIASAAERVGDEIVFTVRSFDHRRIAKVEAELDRKQAELRTSVLNLADALGMEAHEARKEMIRASYLATGTTPDRHPD